MTAALRRLETHYLANPYKNCCFAVLGDFKDSDAEHTDGEDGIIALAKKQTAELNAQYAKDGETIFYFLHSIMRSSRLCVISWKRTKHLTEYISLQIFSVVRGNCTLCEEVFFAH